MIDAITAFFSAWGIWIAVGSLLMFVASIAAVPLIIARIPADYFTREGHRRIQQMADRSLAALLLALLKNLLGLLLLLAGIVMLFTPGQGLLSILFGLMLMNYPGKYALECSIVQKPVIFDALNRLRTKQGKPPLLPPDV